MSTPYPAPPPPPPPAGPAAAGAPWYKKPGPLFLLGLVIAAAIAIPVVLILLGGDDEESAVSTSTTAAVTTTAGVTTTAAVTTTAGVTTTTAGVTTTAAATTTTSGDSPCGDPELDALYQDCADGDMQACDDLYMESPVDSACEAFGDTCGGTTSGGTWCAGGTTTTSGAGDTLDYALPALFADNVELSIGFSPDPKGWEVEAGGPIDAGVLDEAECDGYTTAAPSVEINYSGGTAALLRFYFVADNPGDDTLLIISDAAGNWLCNDDYDYPGGIADPMVDITMAPEGTYDIWVSTYSGGVTIPGTLYVTESNANHP